MTIRQEQTSRRWWWITCDHPDGPCSTYGAATIPLVEEVTRAHQWTSYDGWHQCPRHLTSP